MNSAQQFSKILDRTAPPWVSSPYSLISWWDMEKFSAATFYDFGSRLAIGRRNAELQFDTSMSKEDWKKVEGYKTLKKVKAECEAIGLRFSALCISEFLKSIRTRVTAKQLIQALSETENSIRREMSMVTFFYMPPEQADFYQKDELFGVKVNTKFPSIQYDMVEAGNCMAMGRSTACVFHLMRIMEVGVQEFGKKLGVSLVNEKNWQNILDELNKAIKSLPHKAPGIVEMSHASRMSQP